MTPDVGYTVSFFIGLFWGMALLYAVSWMCAAFLGDE